MKTCPICKTSVNWVPEGCKVELGDTTKEKAKEKNSSSREYFDLESVLSFLEEQDSMDEEQSSNQN
jgi:hypothetical protein